MKVAKLEGGMLNFWVAKGIETQGGPDKEHFGSAQIVAGLCMFGAAFREFNPSGQWSHGGQVIEQERISVIQTDEANTWQAIVRAEWGHNGPEGEFEAHGPSPLIAAMRAFVKSKFGEEVPEI